MTKLIPGKLYVLFETIWAKNIDSNKSEKITNATPILILKNMISNETMNLTFMKENKIYNVELYDNPGFFFEEL